MGITNRQIPSRVSALEAFKTGNGTVFAEWQKGCYVVYSYGRHFPIAVVVPRSRVNGQGVEVKRGVYVNSDRYSVTTSRHQGLVKQGLNFSNPQDLKNTQELKAIIEEANK